MASYRYLIVGGGMAADSAVRGIRSIDTSGSIGIITSEAVPPYNRPPLSKGLWKGDLLDSVWRKTADHGVTILTGTTAVSISPSEKRVLDSKGNVFSYGRLLLATGGRPRELPYPVEGIIYYRNLDDYHRLRTLAAQAENFAVIGAGFIGSEIAAALTMVGKKVTLITPNSGIGAPLYPPRLSAFLNTYYRSKGVTIFERDGVTRVERGASGMVVGTSIGREILADVVVAGLGIIPNTKLAQTAGLNVDNGIVVDEFLLTSHKDIFAAGDVANFYSPALGKRIRVEHEDNANSMGMTAGKNMAGASEQYTHLPFFYSDLFDLGYEAIGEFDVRYQVVEDWKEEFKEGVLYYLNEGRVRGVILWNVWGQIERARQLITEARLFTKESLKGLLSANQN